MDETTRLTELDRHDTDDLRFLTFRSGDDHHVVALYERGLLGIDDDGNVAWHVIHDDISARLLEAGDGLIWVESQWPNEAAGHRYAYRIDDGRRVSG